MTKARATKIPTESPTIRPSRSVSSEPVDSCNRRVAHGLYSWTELIIKYASKTCYHCLLLKWKKFWYISKQLSVTHHGLLHKRLHSLSLTQYKNLYFYTSSLPENQQQQQYMFYSQHTGQSMLSIAGFCCAHGNYSTWTTEKMLCVFSSTVLSTLVSMP